MPNSKIMIDSASRSHTALFVLLGKLWNGLRGTVGKTAEEIEYPVNRPGQNSVECYTLAILVFVLMAGFFIVTIAGFLGAHAGSFALALPLGFLLTFVTLHIQFFGFAFIYHRMRDIGFFPPSAPGELPARVYLVFFTLFAIGLFIAGSPALRVIAAPWLLWAGFNFLAGIILFAGDFILLLSGDSE